MLICKEFDLIPNGKGLNELPLGRLRRFRQSGFLSVIPHSDLTKPFCSLLDKEHSLCKISIASEAKGELLKYIKSRGKDSDFLYGTPDAEEERALSFITELNKSLKS